MSPIEAIIPLNSALENKAKRSGERMRAVMAVGDGDLNPAQFGMSQELEVDEQPGVPSNHDHPPIVRNERGGVDRPPGQYAVPSRNDAGAAENVPMCIIGETHGRQAAGVFDRRQKALRENNPLLILLRVLSPEQKEIERVERNQPKRR